MIEAKIVDADTKALDRQAVAFHRICAGGDPPDESAARLAGTLLSPLAESIEKS